MESADPGSPEGLTESSLEDFLAALDEPQLPFEPAIQPEVVEPEPEVVEAEVPEAEVAEPEVVEPVIAEGAVSAPARSGLLLPVALTVVLVLLLGAVGWLVMDSRDTRAREDARQAALQAARQEAVNLTTISYETADADLGRIIGAATGTLKTQFEAQRAQFPGVLKRDKSVSVGTVLAAGIASQSASTVEALVAVDAAVSNTDSAKTGGPIVKHYRMDMKLVRIGGRWLVSQVAFAGLPQ